MSRETWTRVEMSETFRESVDEIAHDEGSYSDSHLQVLDETEDPSVIWYYTHFH